MFGCQKTRSQFRRSAFVTQCARCSRLARREHLTFPPPSRPACYKVPMRKLWGSGPWRKVVGGIGLALVLAASIGGPVALASASPAPGPDSLGGLPSGAIKHVWLIILENKSYDETFTGLNNNSYLWQTLPSEGVAAEELLRHRPLEHGQLHLAGLRAGPRGGHPGGLQRRQHAVRVELDCHQSARYRGTGRWAATPNWNFGQVTSLLNPSQPSGANAPLGANGSTTTNGCTYPSDVPTLFDQFNLAGVSWKGYAQDLGGAQPTGSTVLRERQRSGPRRRPVRRARLGEREPGHAIPRSSRRTLSTRFPQTCRATPRPRWSPAPGTTNNPAVLRPVRGQALPLPVVRVADRQRRPVERDAGAGAHRAAASAGGGTNCDANHIANLDNPTHGLVHDLQNNTVPALQLDHPGQLQRRPRHHVQGQQPLGRLRHQPTTAPST